MGDDSSWMHGVVSFGPFRLFATERLLKKGDEALQLRGRALDTMIALVERPGAVVTQRELIWRVWPDVTVEEASRAARAPQCCGCPLHEASARFSDHNPLGPTSPGGNG